MPLADDMPASAKPDPAGGAYNFATPAATTIAAADTPVKSAGVTAALGANKGVTITTSNRITMDRRSKRMMLVKFKGTIDVATGTVMVRAAIFKNGALVPDANTATVDVAAGTPLAVDVSILVELAGGDFLEMFVENTEGSANITLTGQLTVVG